MSIQPILLAFAQMDADVAVKNTEALRVNTPKVYLLSELSPTLDISMEVDEVYATDAARLHSSFGEAANTLRLIANVRKSNGVGSLIADYRNELAV